MKTGRPCDVNRIWFSGPAGRQTEAGEGVGGRRAEAVPDRRGRNVQRNKGNRGSPFLRRNESPARPDGPSANGKPCPTDQADWFYRQFPGLAWQGQAGEAAQAESEAVDRPDPDAGIRPARPRQFLAGLVSDWELAETATHRPLPERLPLVQPEQLSRAQQPSPPVSARMLPAFSQMLPVWPRLFSPLSFSRWLSPERGVISGQAGAPCQSRHCGSHRPVLRRSGWRSIRPPTSS